MADLTLTAAPLLGGHDETIGGTRLRERADLAIVSLAIPTGDDDSVLKALKSAYGLALPDPRKAERDGDRWLIRSTADQMLMIFPHAAPDAREVVHAALNGACYTTDQTDTWVRLEISGTGARTALERLCPLDLHDDAFPEGAAARTVMEHMGALILRTGADSYLLCSASSSARSFLHAVALSIRYTT